MPSSNDPLSEERRRLADAIGTRENAEMLFAPKVDDADANTSGSLVLQRLNLVTGTNALYTKFQSLTDEHISAWGPRIWVNTVAHLAENDSEVRAMVQVHGSGMPTEEGPRLRLMEKVHKAFVFFLWIVASPTRPLDQQNYCVLKLIILDDTILLETIEAVRNGVPGGWGWLDMAIAGIRDIGDAFAIRRIKAIATNERVYQALLRRGFGDTPSIPGLHHHVTNYARCIDLTW